MHGRTPRRSHVRGCAVRAGILGHRERTPMRRVLFMLITFVTLASVAPVQAASDFASPAFAAQWKRDESVVTNFWGPLKSALDPMREQYKEASGGKRTVQYFDKGRMELSPGGEITNGLLAT